MAADEEGEIRVIFPLNNITVQLLLYSHLFFLCINTVVTEAHNSRSIQTKYQLRVIHREKSWKKINGVSNVNKLVCVDSISVSQRGCSSKLHLVGEETTSSKTNLKFLRQGLQLSVRLPTGSTLTESWTNIYKHKLYISYDFQKISSFAFDVCVPTENWCTLISRSAAELFLLI